MKIEFSLNGRPVEAEVAARDRLIDVLRGRFRLTSVGEGCGAGECGSCTVLLDGDPICSCLTPAFQARGRRVVTVEGLEQNGELHELQKAFLDHDALQCGFCTPGMLLTAKALLDRPDRPDRREIRRALAGNLCRCTGYLPVIDAVEAVAGRKPPAGPER